MLMDDSHSGWSGDAGLQPAPAVGLCCQVELRLFLHWGQLCLTALVLMLTLPCFIPGATGISGHPL